MTARHPLAPYGFCACGCGQRTTPARHTDKRHGIIKGQPNRYLPGHHSIVPVEERFWPKVDVGHPLGCWKWTACRNRDGYGQFGLGGRLVLAHRAAYELLMGAIPEGMHLDHLCRNPSCVNPDHLEPVTNVENIQRGIKPRKTQCVHGHRYTPENTFRTSEGLRRCRTCLREQRAERYLKAKARKAACK